MPSIPSVDAHVNDLVSAAPELSPEQRDRLAVLLRGRRPVYPNDPHRELSFRDDQAGWRRRSAASRRLEPLDDGTVDPLAPTGRWAS